MCIIYIYIYHLTTPHVALRTCLLRRFAHHPKTYQTRVASHHSLHGCSSVSAASLCTSNKKNANVLYLCVIVQFQRCCNQTILRVAPHTCLLRHVARHKKTISQICVSVCGCAVLKKPQSNFAWLVTSRVAYHRKWNPNFMYLCVMVQFQRCHNPTIVRVALLACLLRLFALNDMHSRCVCMCKHVYGVRVSSCV